MVKQSSTEDDCGTITSNRVTSDASPNRGNGSRGKNSKMTSSSGVRAKIARRQRMRQANSIDNPHGSLSDQEMNSDDNDDDNDDEEEEEISIEEKQDSEPINEKTLKAKRAKEASSQQLTPESARKKNWNTRFANIKHSFEDVSEDDPSNSRSPSMNRTVPPPESLEQPDFATLTTKVEEHSRGRERARGREAPAAARSREDTECRRELPGARWGWLPKFQFETTV